MMLGAFALSQLAALPDALIALWLMFLGEGVMRGDRRLLLLSALGLGVSATLTWFLSTLSTRVQRRFRDKVTIALESHVARLLASVATIAHQERPEYLDRLSVLRNQVFVLDHMYMSLFSTCGWILRLAVAVVLLVSVHPALVLLALFALPTVVTSTWRPGIERAAEERRASALRLATHLFTTATTAPPGKEVRVTRIGPRLVGDRRRAWEWWYAPVAAARWSSARWHALAWAIFGSAYVGAIAFVSSYLRAPAGDVLLVLAAGGRLSAYIGATVGEIGFLRGIWMDGSRRLAWLEDYVASLVSSADQPAPARLRQGLSFEGVSFAYPGTSRLVLDSVSLTLARGGGGGARRGERRGEDDARQAAVQALRADRGPDPGGWPAARARSNGRVALAAGGGLPGLLPLRAARAAVGGGRRRGTRGRRAGGRGRRGPGRGRRRGGAPARRPVDAARAHVARRRRRVVRPVAEAGARARLHARAAAACWCSTSPRPRSTPRRSTRSSSATPRPRAVRARPRVTAGPAGLTILVSHRFSTVRMADLIVVLDGARVAQVGGHDELMAKGGPYAELYRIQAAAYR